MNYEQSLRFLDSLNNFERLKRPSKTYFLNLDRMRYALKLLGNPEKQFRSVLVGGTKGKGSVAFYLAGSLEKSGYKTGLYTSPHLQELRERIALNGRMISKSDLARLVTSLQAKLLQQPLPPHLGNLTYFEWLTLIAFLFFCGKKVDIAVLEVGLGGRLDATNCVDPLLTVMTPVSLEHTRILGRKIGQIAREKSFLIHPRRPLILARQEKDARSVFLQRARKVRALLIEEGKDYFWGISHQSNIQKIYCSFQWPCKKMVEVVLQAKPLYAIQNMGLVLTALQYLKEKCHFQKISFPKAVHFFKTKIWSGRFEILKGRSKILLDGAHNPASAWRLVESVLFYYPDRQKTVIVAVSNDKDVKGILKKLALLKPQLLIATAFQGERAISPSRIAELGKNIFSKIQAAPNLKSALKTAKLFSRTDDLIVVTGSLYLVGEMRAFHAKA